MTMQERWLGTAVNLCLLLGLGACGPAMPSGDSPGGLESSDFELVSENGFDAQDNAVDKNDYAWSMAYFRPDRSDSGHVYVGTGNDMIGLIYQGITAILGQDELKEVSVRPPEIRRYRPDLSPTTWERVFDYRDVEQDPDFQTIGFRHLATYRAASDGVLYLYAATMGENATIWRTATGEPGSWEKAWVSGEIGSVRMMAEHDGILYLALANEVPKGDQIGRIYATDGEEVWPVVEDGFGDPENLGVMCLESYNGWLYAGTMNKATGYEIWKLAGPNGQNDPVQVVDSGGPSPAVYAAITLCVFQDRLYFGGQLDPMSNIFKGFKASDIIRINPDDSWEVVVGPNSISGYASGFNHWPNTYIWSMVVHDDWLYAATYDQVSAFFNMLENTDRFIAAFLSPQARRANPFEMLFNAGADLYKTPNGADWYPVTVDGLGDVGNYGIRTMVSVGDTLYLGTTNPFDGLEVWRSTATGR